MTARRRELCTGHVAGSWIHCASQNADCRMPEQMNPGLLPYSYHGRIQRQNWLIQMSALIVIQRRWLKNLKCKCRNVRSLPGTWRDVSLSMWITQRAAVGKNWPRAQRNRTDGTTFFCCNQHSWMVVWPMHEREAIQQKADKKKKPAYSPLTEQNLNRISVFVKKWESYQYSLILDPVAYLSYTVWDYGLPFFPLKAKAYKKIRLTCYGDAY